MKLGPMMAVIAAVTAVALPQAAVERQGGRRDVLYQVSTLTALANGQYDGRAPFRVLAAHGDFGLGTFERLDGEMVALDGRFFRVRADGVVSAVRPNDTTPFAVVTRFEPDTRWQVAGGVSCAALVTALDERLPSHDRLYAIKISGRFSRLQTRSVPAQAPPYVPLAEALEAQVVFPLQNVDATMVGFWLPDVMQLVNAAGFHFHALTTDLNFGGHVLDCEVASATVEIDETSESRIVF